MNCVFCNQTLSAESVSNGEKSHRACVTAYGLDYDPKSEADAQAFLDRRAKIIEETLSETEERQ